MKRFAVVTRYFLSIIFLISSSAMYSKSESKEAPKKEGIQLAATNVTLDISGKNTIETFSSNNMTFLNKKVDLDNVFFVRTTADCFFALAYQDKNKDFDRVEAYNSVRFRYKWGTATDVKTGETFTTIGDTKHKLKGSTPNKHLLWVKEGWLKIKFNNDPDIDHSLQIGLIPYLVGRGISLGAAYDAFGFLGFNPGFSIDQYAPGIVLKFNPIKDRLTTDFYLALVENNQSSLADNFEKIRENEIGGCPQRGVSRQSYIMAARSDIIAYDVDVKKVVIEPYLVHQHAPDQDLEFKNDVNSMVTTMGCAVEGAYNSFNWGFEGGWNFGELDIRPWDRNETKIARDTDGNLVTVYTKVYQEDPAQVKKPKAAQVTDATKAIVASSKKSVDMNGQPIGTVNKNNIVDGAIQVDTVTLYNGFDRIRPEQRRLLRGFFMVGDFTWEVRPKELDWSWGAGFASGHNDKQQDANHLTSKELMNQKFLGFLPIQSVYQGKRLNHLVIFNQGIPRFNVRLPNADLSKKNVTTVLTPDTINEMTNIMFIGTALNWKVQPLKKYGLNLEPNIIAYWSPETAEYVLADGVSTRQSNNFLGTEITTKVSAKFYEKLKLAGYLGVFLPGKHYKDMCGTKIGDSQTPTGSDWAYVANVGLSYLF